MGEVCAGLAYSHQRGVVHRDIKPGNIMMTTDGQVKIADFGIARLENSSMTQVGTLIGTPSYMAPEQFRGEPVDLRADIWAAGVMLYQLLTGEKPFEGGFSAVMHKALHTEPPPPSQLSVTTPRGFDAVIARALAKRPDDRFRSATEFADAIRAAVNAPAPAPEPAGLPGLPGLDGDATMVAARPTGGGTQPRPAPPPTPAVATPGGKGAPVGLIAGGAGALVVAAAAGWYFVAGPGAGPDPALVERQRQEQAAAEQAAREAAARAQAAQEAAAREVAAREQAAREATAREAQAAAAREAAAREQAARDAAAREAAQREQRAAEAQATAAREQAAAEQAAREAAAREQAARNAAAREQAQRERAAAEQAARDAAAREAAAREAAQREQALREQAARDAAARELAAQQAARAAAEQAQREQAQREEAQRQQQVAAISRLDMRAAAQALATGTPCSLIAWSATDRSMTLSGVVRRGDDAVIRQNLAARGVPEDAARLSLAPFDGPYCPALDLLRPVLGAAGVAPSAEVVGRLPLQKGELMRLDVQMPDWPAHLYVAYFMQSGQVANLVPSALQAAGARVRLGEPQGAFTGWEVDEPYGTDLAVVIASDRPLFGNSRPVIETQDAYLAALAAALRSARAAGTRVVVRPVVIETVLRR
jgi:hypothetical protein